MVTIEVVVHAVNQYIGLFLLEVSVLIIVCGKINVTSNAVLIKIETIFFYLGSLGFDRIDTLYSCGYDFFLKGYDIGESVYVHAFGAYFGLAVSKVLSHNKIESKNEGESYNSNLFAMIGNSNNAKTQVYINLLYKSICICC
jgi:hypothetical protein